MSDQTPQESWQRWQPESLLESSEAVIPPVQPALIVENPESDLPFQAELNRLRQQAEQQGFAAGEQRGLEQGHKSGYQQGFSEGEQAGLAQGMAEAATQQQAQVSRFTGLIAEFQTALDSLDTVIPARLVQLSLNAVRALLGKHIVFDTSLLLQKIEQLMQENLHFTHHIELWVSHADFPLVQQQLGAVLEEHRWTLRADDNIIPGGCRVTADEGELDATLSTQWQTLCTLSKDHFGS